MSLSLRERVVVSLAPQGVAAIRLGRGFSSRVTQHAHVSSAADATSWQAAVQALDSLLARPEWQQADLWVVLSNEFVRYAVIPLDIRLKQPQEREAYVRLQLEKRFGAVAAGWEPRISPAGNDSAVVSAIDRDLLEALDRACLNRVRWFSLQPYLMTAFNRIHNAAGAKPAALLLAEPGRMLLALFDRCGWRAVSSRRTDNADTATALRLLEEESAMQGYAAEEIWVHGLNESLPENDARRWRTCPEPLRAEIADTPTYRLALQALN